MSLLHFSMHIMFDLPEVGTATLAEFVQACRDLDRLFAQQGNLNDDHHSEAENRQTTACSAD